MTTNKRGRPRKYNSAEEREAARKKRLELLTPEQIEAKKIRVKEYREKNKEKIKTQRKKRLESNPEAKQKLRDQKRKYKRGNLGANLKKNAKRRNYEAPHTPTEYKNWYEDQEKFCNYCGFDNETINSYLKQIGEKLPVYSNRLQIERIDSTKGYLLENITLACYICNTHKSDIVSHEDFKEIAKEFIIPKIKKELKL